MYTFPLNPFGTRLALTMLARIAYTLILAMAWNTATLAGGGQGALVKPVTDSPEADLSATDSEAAAALGNVRQWSFGTTMQKAPMLPNSHEKHDPAAEYELQNNAVGGSKTRFLRYEKAGELGGINLGFTDDSRTKTGQKVANWYFIRNSKSAGPLVYGEKLAMGYADDRVKRNPYIRYGHRNIGVNLRWTGTPHYEWMILGGKVGKPVNTQDRVAIFNTTHDNFLIFFDRTDAPMSHAANLGWPDSTDWGKTIFGKAKEMGKCGLKAAAGLNC